MRKLLLLLLVLSCVYLDNVTQPSSVTIGEQFTMTINGNYDMEGNYSGTAWLGMLLPSGFLVDSVVYQTSDTIAGVVTEVDPYVSYWLYETFPCGSNMFWQGFSIYAEPEESVGTYSAIIYVRAGDSTEPGSYLIDYLSGHDVLGVYSVDDSILNQPMLVTETSIKESVEHHIGKGNAVWPTIFRNTLGITTDNASLIEIFSKDGCLVKSFRITPYALRSSLSWDGRDDQNRMLGSGVYFVKFVSGDYEETEKVLLIR